MSEPGELPPVASAVLTVTLADGGVITVELAEPANARLWIERDLRPGVDLSVTEAPGDPPLALPPSMYLYTVRAAFGWSRNVTSAGEPVITARFPPGVLPGGPPSASRDARFHREDP